MRFLVLGYEISRCADLVGRGSVAEDKDWSDGREMGHIIKIEKCQKADVQMSTGLEKGLRARVALMHAVVRIR